MSSLLLESDHLYNEQEGGVAMNDRETGNYLEKDADKKHVTLDIKRRNPRHR